MPLSQDVQDKLDLQDQFSDGIQQLKSKGLLKFNNNNEIVTPSSLQEQMANMQEFHAEQRVALEAEQANNELARNAMHQERQRAGQQLEVNEDWANFGDAGLPKQPTGITGFLGVSNSIHRFNI